MRPRHLAALYSDFRLLRSLVTSRRASCRETDRPPPITLPVRRDPNAIRSCQQPTANSQRPEACPCRRPCRLSTCSPALWLSPLCANPRARLPRLQFNSSSRDFGPTQTDNDAVPTVGTTANRFPGIPLLLRQTEPCPDLHFPMLCPPWPVPPARITSPQNRCIYSAQLIGLPWHYRQSAPAAIPFSIFPRPPMRASGRDAAS